MTRAEILDALRNAKGPDRELDAWIYCKFILSNLRPAREDDHLDKYGYPLIAGLIRCRTGILSALPYTSSLDTAIALVERVRPGCEWLIDKGKLTDHKPFYGAQIMIKDGDAHDVIGEGEYNATPAIALLIALLESMEDSDPLPKPQASER